MTAEYSDERYIKSIGIRLHNAPYATLHDMIKSNEGPGRYGILMLKPGCFSVIGENTSIQNQTEELFSINDLNVIATSCTFLSVKKVHELYPNIFGANVNAKTERLEELRVLLEDYLTDCVFTYLVYGENAMEKLLAIKHTLRQRVERVGNWDVNNWVHVPGMEDLTQDIDILFNHNGCRDCLKLNNE